MLFTNFHWVNIDSMTKMFLNIYMTEFIVHLNYFMSSVNNEFMLKVQLYHMEHIFYNIKNPHY